MIGSTDNARSEVDMHSVPVTALGQQAREMLSALLDPKRVLPSPSNHQRDWRGLAMLVEIPGQYYSSIDCSDCGPTEKVLRLWTQRNDGTATVGRLQECLQTLDRWDVYDDTLQLFVEDAELYKKQLAKPVPAIENATDDRITYHDVALYPKVQRYHAYVLYAPEDVEFAALLIGRLKDQGFMICSEEDLLVGFSTIVGPVSRLISERCQHIIVIYSPEFLKSEANKFYMDYAQSLGIKTRTRKIVPCVYRECELPPSYSFYHKLYYNAEGSRAPSMYNFWDKLSKSLTVDSDLPRLPVAEDARTLNNPIPVCARPAVCATTSSPSSSRVTATERASPQITEAHSSHAITDTVAISELHISDKKPNLFKKIFKTKKSKSKKEKTKQLLKAVAV